MSGGNPLSVLVRVRLGRERGESVMGTLLYMYMYRHSNPVPTVHTIYTVLIHCDNMYKIIIIHVAQFVIYFINSMDQNFVVT